MKSAVVVFGAFLALSPGFAAETAPAARAEASPEIKVDSHLAAALDLLEATNAKNNVASIFNTMTDAMIGQAIKDHPGANEKAQKAFIAAFKDELSNQVPELLKMQAALYAEHFSEADLKSLAAFYRSDVGKRYIAELPAIMKEMMPMAMQWGRSSGLKALEKTQEKLKKEGMKL
jgi:hypothetical protein